MNTYQMGVERFFGGKETFNIDAIDKKDAMEKGKSILDKRFDDNVNSKTLRVIKKVHRKK